MIYCKDFYNEFFVKIFSYNNYKKNICKLLMYNYYYTMKHNIIVVIHGW